MARRRKTRRSGGMLRQQPAQTTPMADKGRREDDEVAHVAEGEVVLPANVRTPEFMADVRQHFEQMGVPLDRYTVQDTDVDQHAARYFAGQQGMLPANPATGRPEFFSAGDVGNNAGRGGSDNGGGSSGGNTGGDRGGAGPSASGGVSPGGGNTGGRAGPTGNEATGPGDIDGAAPSAGNAGVAGNLGMNPRSTGTANMATAAAQMSHQAAHDMSTHSGLGAPETRRQMAEDALTSMRRGTRMAPATERGVVDLGVGAALGLGAPVPTPTPGMMRGFAEFAGNTITSGLESLTGATAANPPGSVGDNTGLAEGLSAEGGDADLARKAALIRQNGPRSQYDYYDYRGTGPTYGGNRFNYGGGRPLITGANGGLLSSDEGALLTQEGGDVVNQQTGGQQFYAGKGQRRGMAPGGAAATGVQAPAGPSAGRRDSLLSGASMNPGTGAQEFAAAKFTSPDLKTQSNTNENDSVENRMDDLLETSNPLMEKAGGRARQQANRRGLLNSSMATQAGQSAMVDAAMPIAQQDAQTAAQKNLSDQAFRQNRAMQGSEYQNRSALTDQQFDNEMELQDARLDTRLELGKLNANVRRDIADMQVKDSERQSAIRAGVDAQNMYQNAFNTISQNPNIPSGVRGDYLEHIQAVQDRNLGMIEGFYDIELDWS